MLTSKQRADLQKFFDVQKSVVAGYVFGSAVKGRAARFSDIDIAVLLVDEISEDDCTDLESQYAVELSELLGREADVTILNHAPPFLKFQVFRYGQCLFERTPLISRRFTANSIIEFFDFAPLKLIMEHRVINRLKKRSV